VSPLESERAPDGTLKLCLRGPIGFRTAGPLRLEMIAALSGVPSGSRILLDTATAEPSDSAAAGLVLEFLRASRERGLVPSVGDLDPVTRNFLDLAGADLLRSSQPVVIPGLGLVEGAGRFVLDALRETGETIAFVGRVTLSMFWSLRHPRRVRWGEIAFLVQRSGAEALPIVALLSFLVGLTTAFSAAVQLRQFGADIFIADLVGIGMTRELGPLMAAILLTGRSGSAFAAEIGTMKISDEIDALTVMGIRPLGYLVMPRIFAVMLALPLLSLFADVCGIAGGMTIAGLSLNLTPSAFLGQLRNVVGPWDVFSGVLKSVVFGMLVAGVGCHRGMRTEGGALGVGRSTTASVVSGIFLIVLADALFVVLFHYLGLE
jgi:phospholipid/cholesterol/gamma-HCH transport system permease protein